MPRNGSSAGSMISWQNNPAGFLIMGPGVFTAGGAIVKNGAGTVSMGSLMTYTGPTYVNAGVMALATASAVEVKLGSRGCWSHGGGCRQSHYASVRF